MQNPIFKLFIVLFLGGILFFKCSKNTAPKPSFYLGGDLSYVNEMEDCGGVYREKTNKVDAFKIFADKGANIVRVRLWHTPTFNQYSSLTDVEKTIKRAKNEGQTILLDFHYSDNWADPSKQIMPAAWQKARSLAILGDSVYNYTLSTLEYFRQKNLSPEMVQIGNETNIGIIQHPDSASDGPINWARNAFLLNKGIEAVTFFNQKNNVQVETMLHIAQPENAEPWFKDAALNNVKNYDWIGLSYYPKWSKFDLNQLGTTMATLKSTYSKRIMIVETGYPYSPKEFDKANNMLGADAALKNYPISPEGQLSFMLDLKTKCKSVGAEGIIYWEPAWISTKCKTQWGEGSHWENAAFFDAGNGNEALPVFKFFKSNF
ncbi:arabinogalactan endo-1,4-beta-galactosidase [Lacihabitans sp. LS3-19]|uniref:glycoside hydrolase family 53 protein n=1 Tax=Lacihabitans sp. LS3-19 TaxID=2487335 RepID=UPI0020CE4F8B|nr:glycosyl hydrolase 53 family protein [Lacihabitans sp. LS3-19]MCP9766488.1 arabinogalactan endo-1,4-beta-galactosidase [Lacihabitans sp. LS3-19]